MSLNSVTAADPKAKHTKVNTGLVIFVVIIVLVVIVSIVVSVTVISPQKVGTEATSSPPAASVSKSLLPSGFTSAPSSYMRSGGGTPGMDLGSGWGGGGGGPAAYVPDVSLTAFTMAYNAVAFDLLADYGDGPNAYAIHLVETNDLTTYDLQITIGGANAVISELDAPIGTGSVQLSAQGMIPDTITTRVFTVTDGPLSATYTFELNFSPPYVQNVSLTELTLTYNSTGYDLLQTPYSDSAPTYIIHVAYASGVNYDLDINIAGSQATITENDAVIGTGSVTISGSSLTRATWVERTFVVTDGALSATYVVAMFLSGIVTNGLGPAWQMRMMPYDSLTASTISFAVTRPVTLTVYTGVVSTSGNAKAVYVLSGPSGASGQNINVSGTQTMVAQNFQPVLYSPGTYTLTITYTQNNDSALSDTSQLPWRTDTLALFSQIGLD